MLASVSTRPPKRTDLVVVVLAALIQTEALPQKPGGEALVKAVRKSVIVNISSVRLHHFLSPH
jgi:hypothetical protein